MTTLELVKKVVKTLDDKKAEDIQAVSYTHLFWMRLKRHWMMLTLQNLRPI